MSTNTNDWPPDDRTPDQVAKDKAEAAERLKVHTEQAKDDLAGHHTARIGPPLWAMPGEGGSGEAVDAVIIALGKLANATQDVNLIDLVDRCLAREAESLDRLVAGLLRI